MIVRATDSVVLPGKLTAYKRYDVISSREDGCGVYYSIKDDSGIITEYSYHWFDVLVEKKTSEDQVNHPSHYGGKDNPYEVIKIIKHYKLGFCLGNTLKYIIRAGKKDPNKHIEDLEKAKWYLEEKIKELKEQK